MTNSNITLTETEKDDSNAFFQFQPDEEANYLAAFTSKDPNDKTAYIEKYIKHLANPALNMRTIKVNAIKLEEIIESQYSIILIFLLSNFSPLLGLFPTI